MGGKQAIGTKVRVLSVVAVVCAVAAVFALPASSAGPPPTRVNLFFCATQGGTRVIPAGSHAVLTTGWAASSLQLLLLGIRDSRLTVTVGGLPDRKSLSYAPLTEPVPGQFLAEWQDDIGPITAPTQVTASWSFLFPITDGLTFNDDGSPFVYSGTLFAGACLLVPGS